MKLEFWEDVGLSWRFRYFQNTADITNHVKAANGPNKMKKNNRPLMLETIAV